MFSKGSRYEGVSDHQITAGGREVTYKRLRILPTPKQAYTHRVTQGERLDHIGHRFFDDSEQFWRICDANNALLPTDLLQVGQSLKIPLAQR